MFVINNMKKVILNIQQNKVTNSTSKLAKLINIYLLYVRNIRKSCPKIKEYWQEDLLSEEKQTQMIRNLNNTIKINCAIKKIRNIRQPKRKNI